MRNFSFVVWMLGYPLINTLDVYLLCGNIQTYRAIYSEDARLLAGLVELIIWLAVGRALWEGGRR